MLTRNLAIPVFSLFIIAFIMGCSNGSSPLAPPTQDDTNSVDQLTRGLSENSSSNNLWGLWEIRIDALTGDHEIIPLRSVEWHVNAITFIETGGHSRIQLRDVIIDGSLVDVNVGLTHPFPGLYQWSGFDVRGTFMSDGSYDEFASDGDLIMSEGDEPRLYNADGWTRWWNPSEFPFPNVLGYKDGVYGSKNAQIKYRANLNGFKYFSDDLSQNEEFPVDLEFDQRGLFKATSSVNWRHYSIDFGSPANWYIFNYAVDASHKFPDGYDGSVPPLTVLPDPFFDLDANMPEAYAIDIEPMFNSLYYANATENGGDLILQIDVYDWQGADNPEGIPGEVQEVRVESPSLIGSEVRIITLPFDGGANYSSYLADLTSCHPDDNFYQDVLVTVTSTTGSYSFGYDGFETGYLGSNDSLAAYYVYTPFVDTEVPVQAESILVTAPNGGEVWVSGDSEEIIWYATEGIPFVKVEYSSNGGSMWNPIDGGTGIMPRDATPYMWDIPTDLASANMLIQVRDASPEDLGQDQSDAVFAIESLTLDFPNIAGDDYEIDIPGQMIEWTIGTGGTDVISNIYIEFSKNSGGNWAYLNGGIPVPAGPGEWEWTPSITDVTTEGRIRIRSADHAWLIDESSADFAVFEKYELTFSEYEDYYQSGPHGYRGRYHPSLSSINTDYYDGTYTSWDFTAGPWTTYLGTGSFNMGTAGGSTIPTIANAPDFTSQDIGMRPTINGTATRRPWWVFRFNSGAQTVHPRGTSYYVDATFTDTTFPGFCIDYIVADMTEQFNATTSNDIQFPLDGDDSGNQVPLGGTGKLYWVNHGLGCNTIMDEWDVNMNSSEFEVIAEGDVTTLAGNFPHCLLIKLRMSVAPTAQIVHTGQLLYQWVDMEDGTVVAFMQTHNEGNSTAGIPYTTGYIGDQVYRGLIGAMN